MKTLKILSLAVLCIFTMSFSCYHSNNPKPPKTCSEKRQDFEDRLKFGEWKAFYSDTNNVRIDFADISSSTLYNPTRFYANRIEEKGFLGNVIDTGVFVIQDCGKILRVKTNLSRSTQITESNPDGWLNFYVIYDSREYCENGERRNQGKDSIVTEVSITGVPFIKYFTLVK